MYMSASAPDAPPFSETIMGCFMRLFFWIAACIILAIWSEAPPAPAATTISTGFVGSHAALTEGAPSARAHAAPAKKPNAFLILPPFIGLVRLRRLDARAPWRSPRGTPSPHARLRVSPARRPTQGPFPRRRAFP